MKIKIIITTTDSNVIAEKISNELLEKNLSPCVQIINNVLSTYKWSNKLVKETEFLLLIKTTESKINKCKKSIEKIHNYETPELVCLNSNIINDKYKKWVLDNI